MSIEKGGGTPHRDLASLVEVSRVEAKPDGAHSFDWTYKMAGLKFHGHRARRAAVAGGLCREDRRSVMLYER